MKRLLFVLLISLTTLAHGQDKPSGKYKLIAIQNKTTNTLDSTKKEHLSIYFKEDTTATIYLTANSCWGSYYIAMDKINIISGMCTEVCCDTKFAMQFFKVLNEIDIFYFINDKLILENSTWTLYLNRIE